MKSTFSEIKSLIDQLAAKINIPNEQLPYYGHALNRGDSFSYIEVDKNGQPYYVAWERGGETFRYKPANMNDLLYHIFEGATSMMASVYELKNRIKGQDFRRIRFAYHEELIGILNKDWQFSLFAKHAEILKKHPFDDSTDDRLDYLRLLKLDGKNHDDAWALACQKHPLPNVES